MLRQISDELPALLDRHSAGGRGLGRTAGVTRVVAARLGFVRGVPNSSNSVVVTQGREG
jgi:hypothetical protein